MTQAVVAVDNMAVASNAAGAVEAGVVVVDVTGSGRPTVSAVGGGDGKDWKRGRRGGGGRAKSSVFGKWELESTWPRGLTQRPGELHASSSAAPTSLR